MTITLSLSQQTSRAFFQAFAPIADRLLPQARTQSAAPANNPDGGWTCNASGNSREADRTCVTFTPTEMAITFGSGGMSSEFGGGETCNSAPAVRLKLKHQLAKPGLRRRGR